MKPLLLVDIDGVLNPYAAETCPDGFREYRVFEGEAPVRLAEAHGGWLRELADEFELAWATGWGEEDRRLIPRVLGLSEYPAVAFPPPPFDPAHKLGAIDAFAGTRPVAWIDDEITPQAERWAAERAAPTLLARADPQVGLTEAMVSEARAWARALAADPPAG